jgi:hypothetical protein
MDKQPRHRPQRNFPDAPHIIVECELTECIHCHTPLHPRKPWYLHKTVQTLKGPLFVAGKSKECRDPHCSHTGQRYYATGTLLISLPYSTYGLDVLAFMGWQHEHEHAQLVEIQRALNQRGVLINERTVGKQYRQFLALLGALQDPTRERLAATVQDRGGLIWALDALQPEGNGTLLYLLYEVLSGTPVAGIQLTHAPAQRLQEWLRPYAALPFPVLATLSDGDDAIRGALTVSWPTAPHQRCQAHFLNNLVDPVLAFDTHLRVRLRDDLGGLPSVPERADPALPLGTVAEASLPSAGRAGAAVSGDPKPSTPKPPLPPPSEARRDAELVTVEAQIRTAIRDAVNRSSRNPFQWGGLLGYQQLEAIGHELHRLSATDLETAYLRRLMMQVDRAVQNNQELALDLQAAHQRVKQIADCLHYPPPPPSEVRAPRAGVLGPSEPLTSQHVAQEMEALLRTFQPDPKRQPAQAALERAGRRLWKTWGPELLPCYDIPGLPPDNLQMEGCFGRLRRHVRRISGRQATRELRDFGQYQVLFRADSEDELLEQLQHVPLSAYREHRRRQAEAEAPRQLLHRVHRDPVKAMRRLVDRHAARRAELAQRAAAPPGSPSHTS